MNKKAALSAALLLCVWATPALAQKRKPASKKRAPAALVHVTPTEKDTISETPSTKHEPLDASNATILATIGPELGVRNFAYNQVLLGGVRSYTNNAIPMGSIAVEAYPLATSGTPIARDIGIVGRFGTSLSFTSKTEAGDQEAKGTWTRYSIGGRGRIHTSDHPGAVLVGIEGTYGDSKFTFTGDQPVVSQVPSVDYKYLRLGADLRAPFGAFALLGGAGYMAILSSGPFGDRFPHATIGGVDAHLGANYRVAQNVEVIASGDYQRIFSKENPQPGEPFVAGGALDQFFIFRVGASLLF
jgi:hypothetical protein